MPTSGGRYYAGGSSRPGWLSRWNTTTAVVRRDSSPAKAPFCIVPTSWRTLWNLAEAAKSVSPRLIPGSWERLAVSPFQLPQIVAQIDNRRGNQQSTWRCRDMSGQTLAPDLQTLKERVDFLEETNQHYVTLLDICCGLLIPSVTVVVHLSQISGAVFGAEHPTHWPLWQVSFPVPQALEHGLYQILIHLAVTVVVQAITDFGCSVWSRASNPLAPLARLFSCAAGIGAWSDQILIHLAVTVVVQTITDFGCSVWSRASNPLAPLAGFFSCTAGIGARSVPDPHPPCRHHHCPGHRKLP